MHTVSLEVAKKLKEAGWEKETECLWINIAEVGIPSNGLSIYGKQEGFSLIRVDTGVLEKFPLCVHYFSPTAGELFSELPEGASFMIVKNDDSVGVLSHAPVFQLEAKTLPDALALLWIELNFLNILETL